MRLLAIIPLVLLAVSARARSDARFEIYTWFDDLARAGRWIAGAVRRHRPALDRGAGEIDLADLHPEER